MYWGKIAFLVLIIFLCVGCASAHDTNQTDACKEDNLTDREILQEPPVYEEHNITCDVNLTINNNESIKIDMGRYESNNTTVSVYNYSSLTVYIDNELVFHRSFNPNNHYTFNIPIDEGNLTTEKHNIQFELKIKDTFKKSTPKINLENNILHLTFNESTILDKKKNYLYRYNSTFTVNKKPKPIITIINLTEEEINITYSQSISFIVNGSDFGEINLIISNKTFDTYYYDKTPFFEEISTLINYESADIKYLNIGRYDVVFEFIMENSNVTYQPVFKKINSTSVFEFKKAETTDYSQDHIYRFNLILNIIDNIKETIKINNSDIDSINIFYMDYFPIVSSKFSKLKVYIDNKLVFDGNNWQSPINYIKSYCQQDYIPVGSHNIKFELIQENTYTKYDVKLMDINAFLYFEFSEVEQSDYLHDYTYVTNLTLNILEKPVYIEKTIEDISGELSNLTINRTDKIHVFYQGSKEALMKVFVDDKEIYRSTVNYMGELFIDTFIPSISVNLENPLDIGEGQHDLRFEFHILDEDCYLIPEVYIADSALHFRFYTTYHLSSPVNYLCTFNTTLNVLEIDKTITILKVINRTYDLKSIVLLNLSEGDDDIGVILSNENGTAYKYDDYIYLEENGTAILTLELYGDEGYDIINVGLYNITIINFNDGTYDTALVKILKADMKVEEYESYEKFKVIFTVNPIYAPENMISTITLDGKTKKINKYWYFDDDSMESEEDIIFDNLIPGEYIVHFHYYYDINYNSIKYSKKITIQKEDSDLHADYEIKDDSIEFKIYPGIEGSSNILTVKIGDIVKTIAIKEDTDYVNVTFENLKSGLYDAIIESPENEKYLSSKLNISFEITYVNPDPPEDEAIENSSSPQPQNITIPVPVFNNIANSTSPLSTGGNPKSAASNYNHNTIKKAEINNHGNYQANLDQNTAENSVDNSVKSYEILKSPSKIIKNDSYLFLILAILILVLIIFKSYNNHEEY